MSASIVNDLFEIHGHEFKMRALSMAVHFTLDTLSHLNIDTEKAKIQMR